LDSIKYALDHRDEAVNFALNYARDMGADLADRFVGMYVNDWTLDYGDVGKRAVQQLIDEGIAIGLLPPLPPEQTQHSIDFIVPG
ncbi:MAG: MqnA/MqnD/SBP family protein, partial [Planctomycetota bacterium]